MSDESWQTVDEPQPDDLALHKDGWLDGRIVTRVEGGSVWLYILGKEAGPFPAENYTYKRYLEGEAS